MKRITRTRLMAALLAWIMLLSLSVPAAAEDSAVASTMQLMKTTGTVSVTNNRGKDVKIFDKMRLYNGYKIVTGEASYSWINLDSAKLVKEDASSELQIQKSGKKLDIQVNSGTLYYNVTEPLEEDESLTIRTSTMSVGIRGTCGWVQIVDKWTVRAYLLEGVVEVSVTDPVTGQVKTAEITGGLVAECVVYPQDKPGDKCDILVRRFIEDDIPGFILTDLVQDEPLCEDIYEDSGLEILPLREEAEERLEQDEEEMREKWKEIEEALEEQEHNVSKDPVWPENIPDKNDSGNNAPSGTPVPPVVPTERTMKIYDKEAQEMLDGASTVRLLPNPSPADDSVNILEVDSGLTVPAGKSLVLRPGVYLHVLNGQTLRVNGTLDVEGANAANYGNLIVTSSNTLHVVGGLFNERGGAMTVTATGRVVVDGTFHNFDVVNLAVGAKVLAKHFDLSTEIDGWKVSDTADSEGYYSLVYVGGGTPPVPETCTITLNANGGRFTDADDETEFTGTIDSGSTLYLSTWPVPTREGYTFVGWFANAAGGEQITNATVFTHDTVIYAHWAEEGSTPVPTVYTVTFDANGGTVTPGSAATGIDGRLSILLPTPTRTGYSFDGWYTAATGGSSIPQDVIFTEDTIIYAHWTAEAPVPVTYTVTLNANGGSVTPSTVITGTNGRLTSLPTPTRTGYDFGGWYTAATGGEQVTTSYIFSGNTTIYAHWTEVPLEPGTYIITFDPNGGTVTTSSTTTNTDGKLTSLLNPTRDGYAFDGWYTEAAGGTEVISGYEFSGNTTIYAHWTEIVQSGTDEDVNWSYTGATTTLRIGGTGPMKNYGAEWVNGGQSIASSTKAPWNDYRSMVHTVIVESGVTTIGDGSLAAYNKMTSVTIPSGVVSIGKNAFDSCSSLPSVTIPNTVTTIGDSAFRYCSDLETVVIPDGVTTIGNSVFLYCSDLMDVTIPDSVVSFGTFMFQGCRNLKRVVLPSTITTIGNSTFSGCRSLTDVTIPNTITTIGIYAFNQCSSLTEVSIPAGVTKIGYDAFDGCSALKDVYYGGTKSQWSGIDIGNNNDPLTSATIHCTDGDISTQALTSDSPAPGYTDVPADAWYAEAVAYCQANGLMDGVGDGAFSPDAPMTRAMLAAVLYRMAGSPAVAGSSGFDDVAAGSWSDAPIAWAAREKLMNGYGGGLFGGEDTVTREQFAAVLWRWQGSPEAEAEAFVDAALVSGWAAGAVDWARSVGVMSGVGGNRFDPQGEATRAQAAVLLMNYDQKFGAASTRVASAMDVMCEPSGILAMEDGSLLVTDTYHKLIWRVTNGVSTVYAGSETVADPYGQPIGGYNDAAPEESYFKEPWAVAPFLDGWAVSDSGNNVVRLITPEQTQTVNGRTAERLRLTDLGVAFDRPTGLVSDEEGNLYVADTDSGAIRKITPDKGAVTTVASGLAEPMGLCWWGGALYAAETGANRIIRIENGKVTVVAGGTEGYEDGQADRAAFCAPESLTVGPDGTIYVADTGNNAVRRIQGGEVTTLAVRENFRADGCPISPRGLLVQGNTLYVCDNFARKVLILVLE